MQVHIQGYLSHILSSLIITIPLLWVTWNYPEKFRVWNATFKIALWSSIIWFLSAGIETKIVDVVVHELTTHFVRTDDSDSRMDFWPNVRSDRPDNDTWFYKPDD